MMELYETIKYSTLGVLFKNIRITEHFELEILTGFQYGDKTDIAIYLTKNGDMLMLSDGGRTRDYINQIFELAERDVIVNILRVTSYYNISTANKGLSLKINSIDEFMAGYQRLFACITFLDAMKIFYA